MEAANRGASEAGGKSIGLSIEPPQMSTLANVISVRNLVSTFTISSCASSGSPKSPKRSLFFQAASALDELMEMLTLMQTHKLAEHNIILIYGRKYWDQVLN